MTYVQCHTHKQQTCSASPGFFVPLFIAHHTDNYHSNIDILQSP